MSGDNGAKLRGWKEHHELKDRVLNDLNDFLQHRTAGSAVTLQRSRTVANESNRIAQPSYKTGCKKVNISFLDGVIAVDAEKCLLHVEPGLYE